MSIHLMRDLERLHRELISMGALVEELIHEAVDSLYDPDPDLGERLAQRDDVIDAKEDQIEDECLKILALHQPVAIDLRRIAAVMKTSSELERVADLGVHLAERRERLAGAPNLVVPDQLKNMAQVTVNMLHQSIDAYVNLDSELARQVCQTDDQVDEMNREVIAKVIRIMQQHADAVPAALNLFSAARHLERAADHAAGIAENVVYLVEGENIRHAKPYGDAHSSSIQKAY